MKVVKLSLFMQLIQLTLATMTDYVQTATLTSNNAHSSSRLPAAAKDNDFSTSFSSANEVVDNWLRIELTQSTTIGSIWLFPTNSNFRVEIYIGEEPSASDMSNSQLCVDN